MKNKKPNVETLENTDTLELAAPYAGKEALQKYLDKSSIKDELDDKELELYNYIRKEMSEGLNGRTRASLIWACLIERIARTAVILDKIERYVLKGNRIVDKETYDFKNKEYSKILIEHRRCIESFENLRWAAENKRSTKIIERMRQVTADWDEEPS